MAIFTFDECYESAESERGVNSRPSPLKIESCNDDNNCSKVHVALETTFVFTLLFQAYYNNVILLVAVAAYILMIYLGHECSLAVCSRMCEKISRFFCII